MDDLELANLLFSAWQDSDHAETDGEHTYTTLDGFNDSYVAGWLLVAKAAKKALGPYNFPLPSAR